MGSERVHLLFVKIRGSASPQAVFDSFQEVLFSLFLSPRCSITRSVVGGFLLKFLDEVVLRMRKIHTLALISGHEFSSL